MHQMIEYPYLVDLIVIQILSLCGDGKRCPSVWAKQNLCWSGKSIKQGKFVHFCPKTKFQLSKALPKGNFCHYCC